jgi:hypothetical protein
VLNIQAEFGTAPATEESKKMRCSIQGYDQGKHQRLSDAFLRLFSSEK